MSFGFKMCEIKYSFGESIDLLALVGHWMPRGELSSAAQFFPMAGS